MLHPRPQSTRATHLQFSFAEHPVRPPWVVCDVPVAVANIPGAFFSRGQMLHAVYILRPGFTDHRSSFFLFGMAAYGWQTFSRPATIQSTQPQRAYNALTSPNTFVEQFRIASIGMPSSFGTYTITVYWTFFPSAPGRSSARQYPTLQSCSVYCSGGLLTAGKLFFFR